MTQARQLLRSFAGGEITPELFGRLDLSKFQTGLALAQNFRTLPHGPAARRSGTRFVNRALGTNFVRLIPFAFSADQTMVIELSDGRIRFHTQGGTLVESFKSIDAMTNANPGVFTSGAHGYANGEGLYVSGWTVGQPTLDARFYVARNVTANTFTLEDVITGLPVSTVGLPAFTAGAFVQRVYSIASPYPWQALADIHFAQSADVLTLVHPSYAVQELRRLGALNWTITSSVFGTQLTPPTGLSGLVVHASSVLAPASAPANYQYKVTTVSADGVDESLSQVALSVTNNLAVSGAMNRISWTAVATPGVYYNVYRRTENSGSFGFIGQTQGISFDDYYAFADQTQTFPEVRITLNNNANEYPSAVTYGEQRRWFAAPNGAPQTIYGTRVSNVNSLNSSFPVQGDDAMRFTIAAQQQNRIRHLVWLSDLLALTAGGEFRIFSQDAPAITPTTLAVKPQGYAGASNVSPVVTSASVLYVQAQGSRLRELSFNADTSSFATIDMSVMAPHLFEGRTITDLTFVRAPEPTLYAVRDDGMLLGLTYVPEQQVYGWHRFVTDGFVESVCTVSEGNEDAVYMVVRRTVPGGEERFVERLARRFFATLADCYFVDSGVTRTFPSPQNVVYGLQHLNGKTVSVLGDGADLGDHVVANGQVTLPESCTVVHLGLPFVSDMQTLPIALDGAAAAGQGSPKNVNRVNLKVRNTAEFEVGPTFDRLTKPPMRDVGVPYDSPPGLTTGEVGVDIHPNWGPDGAICVRQARPLPCTVLSMVPELAVGR